MTKNTITTVIDTPVGQFEIFASEKGITAIIPIKKNSKRPAAASHLSSVALAKEDESPLREYVQELKEYFAAARDSFDVPIDLSAGTAFQRSVWSAIQKIPTGSTPTYGEIALRIGRPRAARAVGNALNKNPVMIVVPCHRVVGANGEGGFACGIKTKRWLLKHERKMRI